MTHRVRTHRWEGGRLSTEDWLFETFELAYEYAIHAAGIKPGTVKIYDDNDCMVHSSDSNPHNTYA